MITLSILVIVWPSFTPKHLITTDTHQIKTEQLKPTAPISVSLAPISKIVVKTTTYTAPALKTQPVASGEPESLSEWLLALRNCESGGDYQKNTGNGYYGAYQFSLSTWHHWNTGYARSDLAPASVQDAVIIENTNATAGLMSQNPGCYAKTGISNKPPEG